MSWFERAIGWRRSLAGDGVRLVHRWIWLACGEARVAWAARFYCELDEAMASGGHDGASGWGFFRNDVTTWLATLVTPEDRGHLIVVAACAERYLRALGSTHAQSTAPIAAQWREALERDDNLSLIVERAQKTPEMRTAGAGGVLSLMEASAGVPVTTPIRVGPSARSGVPLAAPIAVRVMPRTGGERVLSFESVEELSIGRAPDADIHLPNEMTARKHARIVRDGDVLVVEDHRSDNGTWLFETKIDRAPLEKGDVLLIGTDLVRFD